MTTRYFLHGHPVTETAAVQRIAAAAGDMEVAELLDLLQRADRDDGDGEDARETLRLVCPAVEIVVRADAEILQ